MAAMRRAEMAVAKQKTMIALEILDNIIILSNGESTIDKAQLHKITVNLQLASFYLLVSMHALSRKEIIQAKKKLSQEVFHAELMRKRIHKNGDMGDLSHLPELCLRTIYDLLYI
jgi:hypothetical protein